MAFPRFAHITKDLLIDKYISAGKTMQQIADEEGCSITLISERINAFHLRPSLEERYIGRQFGMLTPVEYVGLNTHSQAVFLCECKCGKRKRILSNSLITGNTTSCGCVSRKRGKFHPLYCGYEELHGRIWHSLQRGARERGILFALSIEDAWDLYIKQRRQCALTALSIGFAKLTNRQTETTASLDRIESSAGYTLENVQWVHKMVNRLKRNLPNEEFIKWCNLVAKATPRTV